MVQAALRMVQDLLRNDDRDLPEETSERPWDGWGASLADALTAISQSVLAHGVGSASNADAYQVVIHADAEVFTGLQAQRESGGQNRWSICGAHYRPGEGF